MKTDVFGLPYKGSKNDIANWIIGNIPSANVFVDLFAGGCSVGHAAAKSGKYKNVIFNDLTDAPSLFVHALSGKPFKYDTWISRKMFNELKDKNTLVRLCWSFSNFQKHYMYSSDLEEYKKALWYAVVIGNDSLLKKYYREIPPCPFVDVDARNKFYRSFIKDFFVSRNIVIRKPTKTTDTLLVNKKIYDGRGERFEFTSLRNLYTLQSLDCINRVLSLKDEEITTKLFVSRSDYRNVKIPKNAVVYCDIPYKGATANYAPDFDYEEFFDWCCSQDAFVVVSEYAIDDDRFVCLNDVKKVCKMNPFKSTDTKEKLFVPKAQLERYIGK